MMFPSNNTGDCDTLSMPNNNPNSIEINGRKLHYIEQGGESQQPAIIFIHGGLDDYRCWQFQIDSFSSKNTVLSPTVEGLLILTKGLAILLKITQLKLMLKIWLSL